MFKKRGYWILKAYILKEVVLNKVKGLYTSIFATVL